jgi:hypothetical protein
MQATTLPFEEKDNLNSDHNNINNKHLTKIPCSYSYTDHASIITLTSPPSTSKTKGKNAMALMMVPYSPLVIPPVDNNFLLPTGPLACLLATINAVAFIYLPTGRVIEYKFRGLYLLLN